MTEPDSVPTRHAFLSYVSEDAERVDQLEAALTQAGITVWRDKNDIGPGLDWKVEIRRAITNNSLAFIACFSEHTAARSKSYQFEELALAVSEFRQLPPQKAWIFPVRFADVELPPYDLGPNKDLDSLHRTDLFGGLYARNLIRLIQSVSVLLEVSTLPPRPEITQPRQESRTAAFRRLIRDPQGDLDLEELVDDVVGEVVVGLSNLDSVDYLPSNEPAVVGKSLVRRTQAMEAIMQPLLELAVVAGLAAKPEHGPTLKNMSRAVAAGLPARTGQTAILNHNRYPTLLVLYGVAIGAVSRGNWGVLKTVAVDTKTQDLGDSVPLVGYTSTRKIFDGHEWIGTALVQSEGEDIPLDNLVQKLVAQRGGMRHTPVSDHLQSFFRSYFAKTIRDDSEYIEQFDRAEIMLDLLLMDQRLHEAKQRLAYMGFGAYTWRNTYAESPTEPFMREFERDPNNWPPLSAGLFNAEVERAGNAWAELADSSARVSNQQQLR